MSSPRFTSVLIGYKDVFPGSEPEEISKLLENIPSAQALFIIAHQSAKLHIEGKNLAFQKESLRQWANNLSDEVREKVADAAMPFLRNRNLYFLNQPACLYLMQEIISNFNGRESRDLDSEDQLNLFKAYLLAADQVARADERFTEEGINSIEDFIKLSLTTQLPIDDLKKRRKFDIQAHKAVMLFDYLSSEEGYDEMLDYFIDSIGVSNWEEYLNLILRIYVIHLVNPREEGSDINCVLKVDHEDEIYSFLANYKLDIEKFTKKQDFLPFRESPLFELEEGRFLVLNLDLFIDKIFEGILFDIHSRVKDQEIEGINVKYFHNFKAVIGEQFTEKVLLYKTIQDIEERDWITFSGEELQAHFQGGPDYYIRRRSKVFVFELKDMLFSSAIKNSNDCSDIVSYLNERLVRGTEEKEKGYAQILSFIRRIHHGEVMEGVDDMDIGNPKFYPILVVTDKCLEEFGINHLIKNKHEELVKEYGLESVRIHEPVVIQLDDLISFAKHFDQGDLKLNSIFDQYTHSISYGKYFERTMSFGNFLRLKLKKDVSFSNAVQESLERVVKHIDS